MKKILYITIALLSINLYAGDNPFDINKNMDNLDNDEDSLFEDLDIKKPIKIKTKIEVKKPIVIEKPVEVKKPIVVEKPVEVKKPIVIKKPVKTPQELKAIELAKERAEVEAYEKRRKEMLALKKKNQEKIKPKDNNDNESFDDILTDTSKDKVKIKKVHKIKKHKKHKKHKVRKHKKRKKTINPPKQDADTINLEKEAKLNKQRVEQAYADAIKEMSRDD